VLVSLSELTSLAFDAAVGALPAAEAFYVGGMVGVVVRLDPRRKR
jgi:hypothetical protein